MCYNVSSCTPLQMALNTHNLKWLKVFSAKVQVNLRLKTTSWTHSRNGDKDEWPSSCPSYSSEDLKSPDGRLSAQDNVERDKNLTLTEIKFWFSNQKHSYHIDMNYSDSQILHIIKLLLLVLLVLLIGWLLGLTSIQLYWLLTSVSLLNKQFKWKLSW